MPYSSSASHTSHIGRRATSTPFGSNALPVDLQSQYMNLINNPEEIGRAHV